MYEIWKTNRFNEDILTERVAIFYNQELAESFLDYMATLGESYVIRETPRPTSF